MLVIPTGEDIRMNIVLRTTFLLKKIYHKGILPYSFQFLSETMHSQQANLSFYFRQQYSNLIYKQNIKNSALATKIPISS
jgi:hypothetical protein